MRALVVAAAALLLAGCSEGDGNALSTDQSPPNDAVMVTGSAQCSITSNTSDKVDGVTEIYEHFTCTLTMSDSRVAGTEELEITTRILEPDVASPWVVETATLTTSAGTWQGQGTGVLDWSGVQPYAEGVSPFNYGEMHYLGEGELEGLAFDYYLSGSDYGLAYIGWIRAAE